MCFPFQDTANKLLEQRPAPSFYYLTTCLALCSTESTCSFSQLHTFHCMESQEESAVLSTWQTLRFFPATDSVATESLIHSPFRQCVRLSVGYISRCGSAESKGAYVYMFNKYYQIASTKVESVCTPASIAGGCLSPPTIANILCCQNFFFFLNLC